VRSTLGRGLGIPGGRNLVVAVLALTLLVLAPSVSAQPQAPPGDETRVLVSRFVVTGVSAFSPEQLRPLLHGVPIGVALFAAPAAPGVDTPEDLRYAEAALTGQLTGQLREVSS